MSTAAICLATIALVLGADQAPVSDPCAQAIQQSCQHERSKDYSKAIAVLSEQIPAHVDNYLVNLRLGWLNYLRGKHGDAQRYYQAAIRINPKSIEAKLGCLLPMLAAANYKDAEALATEIVKEDPGSYYGNLRLAAALRLQQKYPQALQVVKAMLVAYPTDTGFRAELALAEAAAGIRHAAKPIDESTAAIAEALRKSYQQESKLAYPEAIQTVLEPYATYPKDYTLNVRLGWLYYMNGDTGKSTQYYYDALQVSPRSTEAGLGYLLPLLAQARYQDAEALARQIVNGDPKNYYANLRLAIALRLQGKYSEAEQVVRPMLEAYPGDIYFINEMALLEVASNQKDAAKQLFATLLSLDPGNAAAQQQLRGL